MASSLKKLEQVVVGDIIGLVFVIGMELIKAVRYAAMNRILQKKVYLDEATGMPNKNKCEEILEESDGGEEISGVYAVCVFDLNNLRTINNSLGHDKGRRIYPFLCRSASKSSPGGVFRRKKRRR